MSFHVFIVTIATYKHLKFLILTLTIEAGNRDSTCNVVGEGMDWVVHDDSLAKVSTKPAEVFHICSLLEV